jgi:23S rRNA (adenine2503-C2)-methyltransferase
MPHILSMLPDEAEAHLAGLGEKPYRARQVLEWIYRHRADSWDAMTTLSKPLRAKLAQALPLQILFPEKEARSPDGAVKVLFRTADGHPVESVLMRKDRFLTACLSSQAGCPLACAFCATGRLGFRRNLEAGEITGQLLHLARMAGPGENVTNVVFMGMGEPLLNADAVFRAIRILVHPAALGMAPSRITLSTAGVLEGLRRLAAENLKVNAALSLNAVDDPTRRRLMPVSRGYLLDELLEAFRAVPATVRDPRTIEYVLLAGENDAREDAPAVARIATRAAAKVNLIPYNPVAGLPFRAPEETVVSTFLEVLSRAGVTVTVRRSMGADIGAACGQLAGG